MVASASVPSRSWSLLASLFVKELMNSAGLAGPMDPEVSYLKDNINAMISTPLVYVGNS